MSGDINFFVVDGYVGADPQINIAPDERATRARFRIATSRKFQKESGDVVEYTEWFSIVCWGASYVEKVIQPYVTKGSFVQVMGRVQNTRWTDQDGIERFGVEVVADRIDLLDKAGAVEALDTDGSGADAMLASDTSKGHGTDIDDEIPF